MIRSRRRALTFGALITLGVLAVAALARAVALPVLALVLAGAVLCALPILAATLIARTGPREAGDAGPDDAEARRRGRWPGLLAGIGHKDVEYAGEQRTAAGYQVHLRLPRSGRVTYQMLAGSAERLEIAARLRHGSLRFERGTQAHQVILHVAERDMLARTVPLPAATEPISINRPVPLGIYADGETCAVTLREVAGLIVGLRGSGKSNLLNVLLAQLARCQDVLVFAIDLKGGRMAAPWIQPWIAGRAAKPVIDWLATDRAEADIMLRALLRAVDARARSCSGGEKIIPSASQPAVLLVCDEVAVILGMGTGGPRLSDHEVSNAVLAGLATRLVMTGRSEAVDLIMATQRGTVTMTGSADLKSQCALRIGLGVGSEADARLIIPDDIKIAADLAGLRHPGSGIVQQGRNGRVMPVKFYRIEHEAIGGIAERFGELRPEPDPILAAALGYEYLTRWSRFYERDSPPAGSAVLTSSLVKPAIAAPVVREITAGPAESGDQARLQALAMLRSAGVKGITVRAIAERLESAGHEVAPQTIVRWLTEEAAAGRVEPASYGRWKWRSDDIPATTR
jgi:S-DNA-T family DNA segregation ATPase FtsK/SpoIIIE